MDKPGCSIIDNRPIGSLDVRSVEQEPTSSPADKESIGRINGSCVCNEFFNGPHTSRPHVADAQVDQVNGGEKRSWNELSCSIFGQASGWRNDSSSDRFDKVDSLPYVIRSKVNVPSFEAHRRLFEQRANDWSRRMEDENRVLMKRRANQVARTNDLENNAQLVRLHKRSNDAHKDDGYCRCAESFDGPDADQAGRLDSDGSDLNGEGPEEASLAKVQRRTILKDEPNDTGRTMGDNNRLASSLNKAVIRVSDERFYSSNGPLVERLDEKKGGYRLIDGQTGYCQCNTGCDDRQSKIEGKRWNDRLNGIGSDQFGASFEPRPNLKREAGCFDRSGGHTFASAHNPRQTKEETSRNKNTQTNADRSAIKVDRSTQTDGKRTGGRHRLIAAPNRGSLTARMIDEILVSRSQLWQAASGMRFESAQQEGS